MLSFFMLLVLYLQLIKEGEKLFWNHRLFKVLVLSVIFCVCLEATGWLLEGQTGQLARIVAYTSDALLISFSMMPLMIWTLYVETVLNKKASYIRKIAALFIILLLINASVALTSPVTHLYFYRDASNVYHRGPLALISISLHYVLFIYNFFLLAFNWQSIDKNLRSAMLLFLFPPLVGYSLQMVFYGLSTAWAGVSLSTLIAYIKIQGQTIITDYLTGLNNRRQLDYYLRYKFRSFSGDKSFAGVMIDIDNFKSINDQYGHEMGDNILATTASILKDYFRSGDFIARFGGDEFVVIFDITDEAALDKRMKGLQKKVLSFNETRGDSLELCISLGYKIFDPNKDKTPDDFLKSLDELMYANKCSKK